MSRQRRPLELIGKWLLGLTRVVVRGIEAVGSRLWALDRRRLSLGILVAGSALAALSILLGGFLRPRGAVTQLLYGVAVFLPLFGVLLGLYAGWLVNRHRSSAPESSFGADIDDGMGVGDAVDSGVARRLSTATEAQYRCQSTIGCRTIRAELTEGAIRAVRTRHGHSPSAAREAVRSGTWTEDPVAAAFLAEESRLPLSERLRAVIDPGRAYRRRVRRTVAAIESLDPTDSTPAEEVEP